MDVMEKLVELLNDCEVKGFWHYGKDCKTGEPGGHEMTAEDIADYLLTNGVMVQEFGHWNIIMDDYDCEMMQCSVCKSEFYDGDNDTVDCMHNYCPHCGAKMMPQPPKGEKA